METLIVILVGILISIGTYLILSRQFLRIVLGASIVGHAVNLLLITSGGLKTGSAPLLGEKTAGFTDAIPQALILTAIVINFAVTALVLVLCYRAYQNFGTDDMEQLRGSEHE
ncbi:multisubunit sodium/proton antiporter, MrpC subunit [Fontibacillus panacisegetis]|uniref:Multisubunit sodium/proton antiporter, MrpC subunit n=1 Tax=Fontibacillus panacisegetis TaxID=670482 RepID=A0A1G7TFM3_9BACL|nr:Na(+)/H(+) antiporter subunit C [Fontibacillus panacisegetis]SDG33360.1 multisubunit sodium/proton antiporter, MrpC subunit [Fontibacillus panacisegetis]